MNHDQIRHGIMECRPAAQFILRDLEIEWLDLSQTQPSESEIEAGWITYQAKVQADKAEAAAKKQALLDRLGITQEEARLLLE